VVSTGGGAPCFFDNMDFIKKTGISLFLDVPPAVLADRILKHGKDDRPLLSGVTELEKELEARLRVRLPYYQRADFTIQNNTSQVRKLVDMITPLL
jgi:shikimate kinase